MGVELFFNMPKHKNPIRHVYHAVTVHAQICIARYSENIGLFAAFPDLFGRKNRPDHPRQPFDLPTNERFALRLGGVTGNDHRRLRHVDMDRQKEMREEESRRASRNRGAIPHFVESLHDIIEHLTCNVGRLCPVASLLRRFSEFDFNEC